MQISRTTPAEISPNIPELAALDYRPTAFSSQKLECARKQRSKRPRSIPTTYANEHSIPFHYGRDSGIFATVVSAVHNFVTFTVPSIPLNKVQLFQQIHSFSSTTSLINRAKCSSGPSPSIIQPRSTYKPRAL